MGDVCSLGRPVIATQTRRPEQKTNTHTFPFRVFCVCVQYTFRLPCAHASACVFVCLAALLRVKHVFRGLARSDRCRSDLFALNAAAAKRTHHLSNTHTHTPLERATLCDHRRRRRHPLQLSGAKQAVGSRCEHGHLEGVQLLSSVSALPVAPNQSIHLVFAQHQI